MALTALVVAGLAAFAPGTGRAGGDETSEAAQQLTQLARNVDLLEKRNELASGNDFYVLLDPARSKLVLMLKGAVLRDYEYVGLEVGGPRIAFRPRHLAEGWQGRIWSEGNLVPAREQDRIEIIPPDASAPVDSTKKIELPPTPEEKYPVPHRYHVRYAGGLSLEVRPQTLDESVKFGTRLANALKVWYRDFRAAVARQPEDVLRLRVVLSPQDAASLYRALPPDTRLLILPPSS